MAVPKQKQSHSRTTHRRSNHKATAPGLVPVVVDGVEHLVPRRLVKAVKLGLIDPAGGGGRVAGHRHDHDHDHDEG